MGRPLRKKKEQLVHVLVACEGKTEENYFNQVVRHYLNENMCKHVKLTVKPFKTMKEIEAYLKRDPNSFQRVLYITDLDVCDDPKLKAVSKLAKIEKKVQDSIGEELQWKTVYCYPSIEFWYLLHDGVSSKLFSTQKEVTSAFVTKCKWYKKPMPINKEQAKWFRDRVSEAINNEKKVSTDSELTYSWQIRSGVGGVRLTRPMSEIGCAITELTTLKIRA